MGSMGSTSVGEFFFKHRSFLIDLSFLVGAYLFELRKIQPWGILLILVMKITINLASDLQL